MAKGKILVGTSGWQYKHWKGTFYPKRLRAKDEFDFYSLFFNTVELNYPFYRLPPRERFESWRGKSKGGFIFVVKANRFITHMKKLSDVKESVERFLHHCDGLEEKLGAILFQLPPGWELNLERFEKFLKELPQGYRYVFEFRNHTWYTKEVYALLKRFNCAFCIYQLAGHLSPIEVTTNWVYIRLHGPTKNKYQGSYDFATLKMWAERSKQWQQKGKDVFIYFDNDDSGYAAFNAQLTDMIVNKKVPVTESEAKIMTGVIEAIRNQSMIELEYESSGGKSIRRVAPYLLAVKENGQGNIFFTGYQYPLKGIKENNEREQFLLSKIDASKFCVINKTFEDIRVDEKKIFGELPTVRVVYRVAPARSKRSTRSS